MHGERKRNLRRNPHWSVTEFPGKFGELCLSDPGWCQSPTESDAGLAAVVIRK